LTYLPQLNENLELLYCYNNQLSYLPPLNEKLEELNCAFNKLTYLPRLNENLKELYCDHNNLTYLPRLNENLKELYCYNNKLTSLPELNNNLEILCCHDNPIFVIIYNYDTNIVKNRLKILNNFRHLYYSLKYKKHFRDWLWIRVREPKIREKYHYKFLIENLHEDTDLDKLLDDW